MKKSKRRLAKESEIMKYMDKMSKEDLILFRGIVEFIVHSSEDEIAELTKMYNVDGTTFQSIVDWIESKRPLVLEVV